MRESILERFAELGTLLATVIVNQLGVPQACGQSFEHFHHGVCETAGGQTLGPQHGIVAADIGQGINHPLDVLMHCIELGQMFQYERANGPLLRLFHPLQRHMVTIRV